MSSFLGAFSKNYLRLRIQRAVADILGRCLDQFTPEGLQLAITDGWSAVDFLSGLSVAELKELLRDLRSGNPSATQESMARIAPQDILAEIAKKLPQHAEVLRANQQWLAAELSKATAFIG